MTGTTIDHMVSVTILIAAMLVTMTIYTGMFASAADYDRNRQVANKAVDIMNTICLSPGNPVDWGETNASVLGFGLQDPEVGGYALSPYSIMRLNTASDVNPLVEYNGTYYTSISTSFGHAILTPIGACINYTTSAELLGINGNYGFSIGVTPTLDVVIKEITNNPLKLNVTVHGSGLPLSGATIRSYLFHVSNPDSGDEDAVPFVTTYSNVTKTGLSGSVDIEFDVSGDGNGVAYSFIVYVSLGGVTGVGYHTNNTISNAQQYIVPLIGSFDNDDGYVNLILTHSYNVLNITNNAAAHYNASFYSLTSDFQLQQVDLENSTGLLNTGSKLYNTTRIPDSETGILFISFMANGRLGSVIVPWGVGALGVPASFGGIGSTGYRFVATELRQVTIDGISYQVKVSAWSLRG